MNISYILLAIGAITIALGTCVFQVALFRVYNPIISAGKIEPVVAITEDELNPSPQIKSLSIGIKNDSQLAAKNVLAEIKIPTDVKYYISYYDGKTYFDNGKGQFYYDLIYPGSDVHFKDIRIQDISGLEVEATIYAENAKNSNWKIHVKKTDSGYDIKKQRQ